MSKRGLIWDTLLPWIIGIAVLVLVFILYAIISGRGLGAIEYFKDLMRFGR